MSPKPAWLLAVLLAVTLTWPLAARAEEPRCPKARPESVAPAPDALPGAETQVYKTIGDQALKLYVRRPPEGAAGKGPRPALVFFGGGGWMFQNVGFLSPQAEHFAALGLVTVQVDYRVYCRDGVNIVDEVKDAQAAMSWVRSHARELGIAPNRIAAVGGSAGGHVALSTAVFRRLDGGSGASARPDLLVLFFPCVDETTPEELKYSAKAIQSYGEAMSPALHVARGLPPMLVSQGTADELYAENKAYCAKVAAAGNACRFVEFKDAPHGFFQPSQKWYQPGLAEMSRFLERHGYLAAEAPPA